MGFRLNGENDLPSHLIPSHVELDEKFTRRDVEFQTIRKRVEELKGLDNRHPGFIHKLIDVLEFDGWAEEYLRQH